MKKQLLMKKQLPNRKTLSQFFYSLTFTLLFANFGWSQTLFEETFGNTAAATFTGGTSSPSVNYSSVTTSSNVISTSSIASAPDMFLNFAAKALTTQAAATSTSISVTLTTANPLIQVGQVVTGSGLPSNTTVFAINGTSLTLSAATTSTVASTTLSFFNLSNRCSLTAPLSSLTSGLTTTKLTDNTKLVTWTVNMRASRTMSSSSNSYADGSYYLAAVLCASTANLTDGAVSKTDGYALILQRSLDNAAVPALNPGAVRLVKFHNGIGSSAGGSEVSDALLTTPALNSGAAATAGGPNNVSIKVEYNPNSDSWSMYYREDPLSSGFVDPSAGTFTKIGSITDVTYTSTAMTHFGYLAGLSASSSAANQLQLNNFKIALSDAPAFTPAPVVEKRQAFNTTPTPTVAQLVPAPSATINWYATATSLPALSSTDQIATGTYYVTQTLNALESERVIAYVYVGDTSLKTLPFYEPFNYPLASATTDNRLVVINNNLVSVTGYGSWSVVPTVFPKVLSPDDMVIANQPGAWTSSILPTPTANALIFDKSGLDPQLLFAAPTTGSVYASCLFMVTDLNSITAGTSGLSTDTPPAPGQIFSFAYSDPAPGSNTSYTAAVYLKKSAVDPTKFNIGINAAPAEPIGVSDIFWDATDYTINTPITLVTRYSYDDLISKLWINPVSNEDTAANVTTLPRPSAIAVDRLRLNQSSTDITPFVTLDEIRVANNFSFVTGGPNLGLTQQVASKSQCTVYPNPVSKGKLYIISPSSSEKQVAIYSILGQKVLEAKTTNNAEINVSKLAKGNYILKITEDGKSEAKKLIVQ